MTKRVITACVLVGALLPVFHFSGTVVFPVVFALFSALASYELQHCVGCQNYWYAAVPSYAFATVSVLMVRYTPQNWVLAVSCMAFVYLFTQLCGALFSRTGYTLSKAAELSVMQIYAAVGFLAPVALRDMEHGVILAMISFIAPWFCDVFALFSGKLFGKHKLIAHISPKKTVEGAIGGVLFSVVALLIFAVVTDAVTDLTPRYPAIAVMGVILAVVSQCGDLIASMLKRQYGIKDYGRILPGHGGILDRFDSIIAVSSFLLVLSQLPHLFGFFF